MRSISNLELLRKAYAVILVAMLALASSCSTSETPQPDLAAIVAGTYRLTAISTSIQGTITLPSNANQFIIITTKSKNTITIVNQFSTGSSYFDNVQLTGTSSNIAFQQTLTDSKIKGTISGNKINYSITLTAGGSASVTAVKI